MQEKKLEGFWLSQQQKYLWLQGEHGPCSVAQCAIAINGDSSAHLLRKALSTVVKSHEILRTTFHRSAGVRFPLQVVNDDLAPLWQEINLDGLDYKAQRARIEQGMAEGRLRAFDHENGPIVYATLFVLSELQKVLLIEAPTLCMDAQTLNNMAVTLGQYYDACSDGVQPLNEGLQYADYCAWQSELSESRDDDAQRARMFWQEQVQSPLRALVFRSESQSAAPEGFVPDVVNIELSSEIVAQVNQLAEVSDVTVSAVLFAVWQLLLCRLFGSEHFAIGTLVDGRAHEDIKGAVGPFARFLPLRRHLDKSATFIELVKESLRSIKDAAAQQDYFDFHLNGHPLHGHGACDVTFEALDLSARYLSNGASFSIYERYCYLGRFKLGLRSIRQRDSLALGFQYNASVFQRHWIERLAGQYEALLKSAVATPSGMVSRLTYISNTEQGRFLANLNQTNKNYPSYQSVHLWFEEQVERSPDRVSVVFEGNQLTYNELNHRANQLARHLLQYGARPDACIGICLERSLETIIATLGVMKAGSAYVPLDPYNPRARLLYQITEAGIQILISQESLLGRVSEFSGHVVCIDRTGWRLLADEAISNLDPISDQQNLIYIIYTSGSTGVPKGVAISHRSLLNYIQFICDRLHLTEVQRDEPLHFALVSTFTADLGYTCLYPSLVSGGCLHVISHEAAITLEGILSYNANNPIDVMKIAPSHLSAFIEATRDESILPRRHLIIGGEALSFELVERIKAISNVCNITNHYGPTEATVGCLTNAFPCNEQGRPVGLTVPIGTPIANAQAHILDKDVEPVPVGVEGELYVGGTGLARGYLNQPHTTAERFIPNPLGEERGSRLYRTGDLVRHLDDGTIEFLTRADNQVKIRGFRVELKEIEAVLKQHSMVQDAVVLAEEDKGGHKRLSAYVVSGEGVTEAQLRAHIRDRLPDYMTPSAIVTLKRLPLTANGKVDLNALASSQIAHRKHNSELAAPRTRAEAVLAQIWCEVLGLGQVGINDNFFDLGGDSILVIQIVAQASRAGLHFTPKQLFQYQTIAELVFRLDADSIIGVEQSADSSEIPLTPIQRWFLEREILNPHLYSQIMIYDVQQKLDGFLLKQSVQHVLEHHDALRLRFVREEFGWKQSTAATEDNPAFFYHDLAHLIEDEQKERIESVAGELRAGVSLSDGPLIRVALFRLGDTTPDQLLIIGHYLAIDNYSWRIVLEDIQTGLRQLAHGRPLQLPQRTTPFSTWARRLQRYAGSEEVSRRVDLWIEQLRRPISSLPVDYRNGQNTVESSQIVSVALDEEETASLLRDFPSTYNVEIEDLLLLALAQSISKWSKEDSVVVDIENRGRSDNPLDEDLSRTVGNMAYRFPVMLAGIPGDDPAKAIKAAKERLSQVRDACLSYGLLWHMQGDQNVAAELKRLRGPDIYFSYDSQLGQIESGLFSAKTSALVADRDLGGMRPYQLEITALICGSGLRVVWGYSENVYKRSTIEGLARDFIDLVRSLIDFCRTANFGAYVPSDFPGMEFDQQELNDLISKLTGIAEI